jgi:Protein of unknown function (DUF3568)
MVPIINKFGNKFLLLLIAAVALANSGCLLVAAGAAGGAAVGYAYYKGKIAETYRAGFNDSWAATRTALAELGMPILKEERGTESGTIESKSGDGEQVRVSLEATKSTIPADGDLTEISIRVATFGNVPVSDRIFYQIGIHLVPANYVPPPTAQAPWPSGVTPTVAVTPVPNGVPPQQTPPPPLLPPTPEPIRK